MATDYGDSSWGIVITEESGEYNSGAPSGDRFFLVAKRVQFSDRYDHQIEPLPGGTSYAIVLGQRVSSVRLLNVRFLPVSTDSAVDVYNQFVEFYHDHNASGSSAVYIAVKDLNDDTWVKLGYNDSTSSSVVEMSGYMINRQAILESGTYALKSLEFRECDA